MSSSNKHRCSPRQPSSPSRKGTPWSSISAPVTLEQEKWSEASACTAGVAMTLTALPLWRSDRMTSPRLWPDSSRNFANDDLDLREEVRCSTSEPSVRDRMVEKRVEDIACSRAQVKLSQGECKLMSWCVHLGVFFSPNTNHPRAWLISCIAVAT